MFLHGAELTCRAWQEPPYLAHVLHLPQSPVPSPCQQGLCTQAFVNVCTCTGDVDGNAMDTPGVPKYLLWNDWTSDVI